VNYQYFIENAVKWAIEHLGSGGYPFLCLAFVEDAYEQANGIEIFGGRTAKNRRKNMASKPTPSYRHAGGFRFL